MMTDKYILEGHTPVPCDDLMTWAKWYETAERKVRRDEFGDVLVSTVFLGLDFSFGGDPLQLFETMVFGGPLAGTIARYATWDEADAGHNRMIERVVGAMANG